MIDYKQSGVSIDAGNLAVQLIKSKVAKTHSPKVLGGLGSFAAFYQLGKYKDPILVSCTDGVGTKLRLAIESRILNTVGVDLVAMSVNDLVCCGAQPLFFLDYIAVATLVPEDVSQLIDGMVEGCLQSGCALVGGEMAEMNDMYREGDFDLAGFCVGVVERDALITGNDIAPGDKVYALPSSGIHSNGFSLVRKCLPPEKRAEFDVSIDDLLVPTRIYVQTIQRWLQNGQPITGIAHITGGGLQENVARILPKTVDIVMNPKRIAVPDIFRKIQAAGPVSEDEMWKVFNMGVGMVVITKNELPLDDGAFYLGEVIAGTGDVHFVG